MTARIGRNSPCPCGSGKKYKKCCWGERDWDALLSAPDAVYARNLSLRGKNLFFMNAVAEALELDPEEDDFDLVKFKQRFTPEAVERIFSALCVVWPDGDDLDRVLQDERENTSGLYHGFYDPARILQGLTRHSLYSESLLLVDPLPHPARIRPEYNPLHHPEQYRSVALL